MKSTINISQVYGRIFSETRQITPMEYRTIQKYQSTETCKRFIPVYSKSIYYSGIPDSPFLSDHKFCLVMRWK
jgi:hypothetical protein